MKIDVASAIEEILDRRDTVCLPGIGSLRLENLSAKLSKDGKSMAPPSVVLSYFDTETKNKPLRKYIAKKYDIPKEKAEKAIFKFSNSLLTVLKKEDQVEVEGVLRIIRNGGKYRTKALDGFLNKYYQGLPKVKVKKLKKKSKKNKTSGVSKAKSLAATEEKENKSKAPVDVEKDNQSKKAAAWPIIEEKPILEEPAKKTGKPEPSIKKVKAKEAESVVEPIKSITKTQNVAITKDMLSSKPAVPPPPSTSSISSEVTKTIITPSLTMPAASRAEKPKLPAKEGLSINDKFSVASSNLGSETLIPSNAEQVKSSEIKPSTIKGSTIKESTVIPSRTEIRKDVEPIGVLKNDPPIFIPPSDEGSGFKTAILGLLGLILFSFLVYKGCTMFSGSKSKPKVSAVVNNSSIDDQSRTTAMNGDDSNAESTEGTDDSSTGAAAVQTECIIITGVFSHYQNVNKMEEKLVSLGYAVHLEEYGPYTRVGFTFDCEGEDLPRYIQNIRKQISSKAWYLEPELFVEY